MKQIFTVKSTLKRIDIHENERISRPADPCSTEKYRIFQTVRCTFSPQMWEKNRGVSYSPNVAFLASCREGRGAVMEWGWVFFP